MISKDSGYLPERHESLKPSSLAQTGQLCNTLFAFYVAFAKLPYSLIGRRVVNAKMQGKYVRF